MTSTQIQEMLDRSFAIDPKVDEALSALMTEARLAERWAGLSPPSLAGHHRILISFLEVGVPPDTAEFPNELLDDLSQRDLVHVRDGKIALAYPFATEKADFSVTIAGIWIQTVCAIDALGVAALAGRSTHVRCLCPVCQSPTNVDIAADGLTIESTSSPDARVWTGVTEVGACAADTQCKSMLLFCSHAHLDAWRRNQSADMRGFDLSLEQGIQLGAAIFRPFLERATKEANL
tara:strand:- start:205 stop:906 length:702 start_codon:yes stop_codon:yes gene_type:complete